jgi:hypothetical protein
VGRRSPGVCSRFMSPSVLPPLSNPRCRYESSHR